MSDPIEQAKERARSTCNAEGAEAYREGSTVESRAYTRKKADESLDALIAAVRADTLHAVEQEARRRAEECFQCSTENARGWEMRMRFVAKGDAFTELADFCRTQREGA